MACARTGRSVTTRTAVALALALALGEGTAAVTSSSPNPCPNPSSCLLRPRLPVCPERIACGECRFGARCAARQRARDNTENTIHVVR